MRGLGFSAIQDRPFQLSAFSFLLSAFLPSFSFNPLNPLNAALTVLE